MLAILYKNTGRRDIRNIAVVLRILQEYWEYCENNRILQDYKNVAEILKILEKYWEHSWTNSEIERIASATGNLTR